MYIYDGWELCGWELGGLTAWQQQQLLEVDLP